MHVAAAWFYELQTSVKKDKAIYIMTGAYGAVTATMAGFMGGTERLTFFLHFLEFIKLPITALLLVVIPLQCCRAIRAAPQTPAQELLRRMQDFLMPAKVARIGAALTVAMFFGIFISAKNLLPLISNFSLEKRIADFDFFLHRGDAWRLAQTILGGADLRLVELMYGPIWFFLISAIPITVAVTNRLVHVRVQFLITWGLCWIVLGNIFAGMFMSAGPAFYGNVTGDHTRFFELQQMLSFSKGALYSAADYQSFLWENHKQRLVQIGTGISAFPSLHVSMATLFFLLSLRINKPLAFIAGAYAIFILLSSVYLGWHYAVDGYFSILITTALWKLVGARLSQHGTVWFQMPPVVIGPHSRT